MHMNNLLFLEKVISKSNEDLIISTKLWVLLPKINTLSWAAEGKEHKKHFHISSTTFFGVSLAMACSYTEISHNLRAKISSLAVHWFNWLFETQWERNVVRMWAAVPFGEALCDRHPERRLRRRLGFSVIDFKSYHIEQNVVVMFKFVNVNKLVHN